MNDKMIQDTSKKHMPPSKKGKRAFIAFVSGGFLAVLAQLLMMGYMTWFELEKDTATAVTIVTIIFVTALLTGLGIFDKIAQVCGAGAFIPISGFANALTSCAMEGRSEGPIYGIGSNMFKLAGSVLTYGIVSAFVFGMIRYVLFGG